MTERVCFTLQVRDDRLEEYRRRHRAVWPEMVRALTDAGWRNYSLFLRADGLLIGYLETESFAEARRLMAETDVNERWQEHMASLFSLGEVGRRADAEIVGIEEVFHLP